MMRMVQLLWGVEWHSSARLCAGRHPHGRMAHLPHGSAWPWTSRTLRLPEYERDPHPALEAQRGDHVLVYVVRNTSTQTPFCIRKHAMESTGFYTVSFTLAGPRRRELPEPPHLYDSLRHELDAMQQLCDQWVLGMSAPWQVAGRTMFRGATRSGRGSALATDGLMVKPGPPPPAQMP